jgi:hypothetical protein
MVKKDKGKKEKFEVSEKEIRVLVEQFYDLQQLRIKAFGPIVAYVKNHAQEYGITKASGDEKPYAKVAEKICRGELPMPKDIRLLVYHFNTLYSHEKYLNKVLDSWSRNHPLRTAYLNKIYGIGPVLASGIIAWLHPISRFDTVSKLWAYVGLPAEYYRSECVKGHVFYTASKPTACKVRVGTKRIPCGARLKRVDHFIGAPKREKGAVSFFNLKLRTFMWKVGKSFEYQNPSKSFYKQMYLKYKDNVTIKHPDYSASHIRNMTIRWTIKLFLEHLWAVWRQMEGLPVTKPYALEHLGHGEYIQPHIDKPYIMPFQVVQPKSLEGKEYKAG